jgi:hypothetical protein
MTFCVKKLELRHASFGANWPTQRKARYLTSIGIDIIDGRE